MGKVLISMEYLCLIAPIPSQCHLPADEFLQYLLDLVVYISWWMFLQHLHQCQILYQQAQYPQEVAFDKTHCTVLITYH